MNAVCATTTRRLLTDYETPPTRFTSKRSLRRRQLHYTQRLGKQKHAVQNPRAFNSTF